MVASGVAQKRALTDGRVGAAFGVIKEGVNTVGRVAATGCVAKERSIANSRVEVAFGVAKQRKGSIGRVAFARGVA